MKEIDETICDCGFDFPACPVHLAYVFACQAVHLRDRLKMYEDTGLEPEEASRRRGKMFALINKTTLEYLLTKYEGMSLENVQDVIQCAAFSENVTLCKDCRYHREPDRCILHSLGGMYNPLFFCADGEPIKQKEESHAHNT